MSSFPEQHPAEDRLFSLVHDLLPAGDRDAVLSHVKRCDRCEGVLKRLVRVRESARSEGPPSGLQTERSAGGIPGRGLVAAGAVAAVLVLALGFGWGRHQGEAGGRYWLTTDLPLVAMRAGGYGLPPALREGLDLYEERRLPAAIGQLSSLDLQGSVADLRDVYLSSALVNAGRYAEAEPVLERLDVATLPAGFRQAAQWSRYVLLSATGRTAAARADLEAVAGTDGEPGRRARLELKRLAPDGRRRPAQGRP